LDRGTDQPTTAFFFHCPSQDNTEHVGLRLFQSLETENWKGMRATI